MTQVKVLNNVSGATTGESKPIDFPGRYMVRVDGNFDGATVSLEVKSPDGVSWLPLSGAIFTASDVVETGLPFINVRGIISGGTSPTGMYLTLDKIY